MMRPAKETFWMTVLSAAGVFALAGCGKSSAPPDFSALTPKMSPLDYFTGHASSFGVLESPGGAPTQWFKVESVGAQTPDGALTDASGPVTLEATGPLLHLSYPMKSIPGSRMEQWLYLQDDKQTLLNEGSVTVFGVLVARLSERIGRDGG
jgi:hypothetical protein